MNKTINASRTIVTALSALTVGLMAQGAFADAPALYRVTVSSAPRGLRGLIQDASGGIRRELPCSAGFEAESWTRLMCSDGASTDDFSGTRSNLFVEKLETSGENATLNLPDAEPHEAKLSCEPLDPANTLSGADCRSLLKDRRGNASPVQKLECSSENVNIVVHLDRAFARVESDDVPREFGCRGRIGATLINVHCDDVNRQDTSLGHFDLRTEPTGRISLRFTDANTNPVQLQCKLGQS